MVTVKKGEKKRGVAFTFSGFEVEEIFERLDGLIKECREEGYRTTTSKHWEDLVEENEEILEIFSKKSKGLFIFNLIFSMFSLFLAIGTTLVDLFFGWETIISYVLLLGFTSALFNVKTKFVLLENSLIINDFFYFEKVLLFSDQITRCYA